MSWHSPAAGRITSRYGPRELAGAIGNFHFGVDMSVGVAVKTPVYAAAGGTVRTIWKTAKGAWVVDIAHSATERTRYIHMELSEILVSVGQRVSGGQRIGTTGRSGASSIHLHFETLAGGTLVDPVPFMAARGVRLGVTLAGQPGGGPGTPNLPNVTPPKPIDPAKPAAPTQEDDMVNDIIELSTRILGRGPSTDEILARLDQSPREVSNAFLDAPTKNEPLSVQAAFQEYLGRGAEPEAVAAYSGISPVRAMREQLKRDVANGAR